MIVNKRYLPIISIACKKLACFVVCLSCLSAPMISTAAVLEEVVVTAQKREESLQDVPISITAITGDAIQSGGIQRLDSLAATIPNLHIAEAVSGSDQFFVRGIGSGVNAGFEMAVGQVIDGFFYGRSRFARAAFLDVERIEVLKGPQGALIGKNTSAGAINITTRKPTDEFEGYITPTYEFDADDGYTIEGAVSGPFSDTLKGRVAVRYDDRDGWIKNLDTGQEDQSVDDIAVRGTLVWEPNDDFDAMVQYMFGDYNRDGRTRQATVCHPGLLGFLAATGNTEDCSEDLNRSTAVTRQGVGQFERFDTEFDVVNLTMNWRVGEHTITSLTGYASTDWIDVFESDLTSAEQTTADFISDEEQFTQEFRIADEAGGKFDYVAGLFYQNAEVNSNFDLHICIPFWPVCNLGPPATPPNGTRVILTEQDSETIAFFGQMTWNINEQFSATFSGRFTHEEKDGTTEQFPAVLFTKTARPPGGPVGLGFTHLLTAGIVENNFSPGGNIQWRPNDDMMFYFSGSRGFKGGGFDHQLSASQTAAENGFRFSDESVTAFEVGGKIVLLDGAAQLNFALFHQEFSNLQISALQPDISFQVGNAASATSKGIEVDGKWAATDALTLSFSMSYLDAEYDTFTDAPCNGQQVRDADPACTLLAPAFTTGIQDLSGQPLQFAPEWNFVFDAEHVWALSGDLNLTAFFRAYYVDDHFLATDLDPNVVQDDYWKIDARLAVSNAADSWELAIIGRNLTDEITAGFGNDGNGSAGNSYFKLTESPRAIALQVTYRF